MSLLTTAEQVSELCQSSIVMRLGLLPKVGKAGGIGAGVKDSILAAHDWAPLDGDCPADTVLRIFYCVAKRCVTLHTRTARARICNM